MPVGPTLALPEALEEDGLAGVVPDGQEEGPGVVLGGGGTAGARPHTLNIPKPLLGSLWFFSFNFG